MSEFEPQREGAFLAYLRRIVLNAVRDELRRAGRRPGRANLDESLPQPGPSLVEQAIGRETMEAYEVALATLPEEQREAVIMRIEFGYTYPEIAEALGAHVVRHEKNGGYGAALRSCFETARSLGAEKMVIIDSDGQHDALLD